MSIVKTPPSKISRMRTVVIGAALALTCGAAPAFAGQSQAETALSRADAKIESATRQSGQAGDKGDQSFNMARERLVNARAAQKSNEYDKAERLADESSLLADLTVERATLAALVVSHDNLVRSIAGNAVVK